MLRSSFQGKEELFIRKSRAWINDINLLLTQPNLVLCLTNVEQTFNGHYKVLLVISLFVVY